MQRISMFTVSMVSIHWGAFLAWLKSGLIVSIIVYASALVAFLCVKLGDLLIRNPENTSAAGAAIL